MTRRRSPIALGTGLAALLLAGALGCSGTITEGQEPSAPGAPRPDGTKTPPAPDGTKTDPGAPASAAGPEAPFAVVRETLRLLPFDTRLNRLAMVVGVPTTDKLLEAVRARRLELGDQDVGKGVTPDPSWSPTRMTLWVRLMRPICQSGQIAMKYPTLRTDPSPLIAAAYGRPAEPADVDAVKSGLAGAPDASRAELTCLAILSSVEFVAR